MLKVQQLIEDQSITHQDVMDYLRDYHSKVYQEEMDRYEQEMMDQEGYDDFGSAIDAAMYQDEDNRMFEVQEDLPDSEYVVLSTAYEQQETYGFPANEQGEIISFSDLTQVAARFAKYDGPSEWLDTDKVLRYLEQSTQHTYTFVKEVISNDTHKQLLYKRTDL